MTALIRYEAARTALAEALRVDEVKDIHDVAAAIGAYARQAKDYELQANAIELRERAERKLGEMLIRAKESGQIVEGRPRKTVPAEEQFPRLTLETVGIDRKLSSRSQRKAGIALAAFEMMIGGMRDRIIAGHGDDIFRDVTTSQKQETRAARERVLGACQSALPDRKYGVILGDPEWRFEPWSRSTGMDRAADNHYPTSCTEVIAARDVPSISAKDCVLFLWATAPMLPHALLVMSAWGFDYKSMTVWNKTRDGAGHGLRKLALGTGYWFRNAHEMLLVGTRGDIPAPAPGTQWCSSIDAPIGAHSEKPEVFLEMIEQYFPTLPKIELNRRGSARLGWSAWGNEATAPERAA